MFRHGPAANRTVRVPPAPALDLSPYAVLRLKAKAFDGTLVPLSAVLKKGLPRGLRVRPPVPAAAARFTIPASKAETAN